MQSRSLAPRVAAKRCATLLKTERYEKKAKNLSEFTE
jgi:hypothetical protein